MNNGNGDGRQSKVELPAPPVIGEDQQEQPLVQVPMPVIGRQRQPRIPQKKLKEMRTEFKKWKKELHSIIDSGAQLIYHPHTGSYEFVLPTRLVKLVWGTTIKERIKAEQADGLDKEEAEKAALRKLRDELMAAEARNKAIIQENEEAAKNVPQASDQEEEAAGDEIRRMRERLVKGTLD